jgi:threonine/homoserine/homoserine lactone efflux protein
MNLVVLTFVSFVMGFVTSIPIGATQIEIAKRALHKHIRAALAIVAGAAISDLFYGVIALFGIVPILQNVTVHIIFGLVCALVLLVFAFHSFRQSRIVQLSKINVSILKSKRLAFVTGLLLALTNPLMVLWWLIGSKIIRDLKILSVFTPLSSIIFIFFVVLGMVSYLVFLVFLLDWAHKFISLNVMRKINFSLAVFLCILSMYFLYSSFNLMINHAAAARIY